jgi:hypothetical protein
MKAFEIHVYQGGRWKIDSIFDDRELAVFEAQRMDISGRFPGVRVVEEVYDEASNTTTNRTIFRGARVAKANEEELQKTATVRRQATAARRERTVKNVSLQRQAKRRAVQKKASPLRLATILVLLVGFALGAMYGLTFLKDMI